MQGARFSVLDGWRGLSILSVLACHLLPLGPKTLQLNFAAGVLGMSLFFTLSGFLVTHFLMGRPQVIDFLIRRFFRILPLAWLYILIALLLNPVSRDAWLAHLFFYANYPPKPLIPVTDHLWSLCVEMHFYIGLALLVASLKKNGLLLIPLICLGITALRVLNNQHVSVITHFRVDEILAGGILALNYNRKLGDKLHQFMSQINYAYVLVLLLISCHPAAGFMNYLRPYFAATLVGATLFNQNTNFAKLLEHKWLFYIASISYALYVIHPLLLSTWLGSGDLIDKYSKRPLLFLVLFACAHVSTFYYEQKVMAWGKRLSKRIKLTKVR
ncbi:MAG: acyltransferase [Methylotenera sp.]|uniref:acyltransferase family protein n=1 Tax=Methylotenera sp. TaxID=2051956 RepID=UPI0018459E26|nr:acyltransferase [Methylotenera sp.]NOU25193.1 acyltransferase [Methylotenera sp.]